MGRQGDRSSNPVGARTTVGFVLASLHTGASIAAWPGVASAAERAGVDLFCFPGGRLGLRQGYEASRNEIYDLAARAPLDGVLVWASSLAGAGVSGDELDAFLDRYRDLPAVSISAGVSRMPVVAFDFYLGMREAVRHAALVHGYRRMAFIRGPARHPGAEERLKAFLDTLAELGIPSDPLLISSPWPWDSGEGAAAELLDERGLAPGRDFDVIIASSDLLALAAAREMQSQGYRIPEDFAILGVNNSVESRIATPPLTTVDCPFSELGELGLYALLNEIRAKAEGSSSATSATAEKLLKPRLVIRRSCGCGGDAVRGPARGGQGSTSLEGRVEAAVGLGPELARDWIGPLVEAWGEVERGQSSFRFLDLLGRVLDRAARAGMDLAPWQGAVTEMRAAALPAVGLAGREALEEAAQSARTLISEAAERAHAFKSWERDRLDRELRELDHELIMALDARRIGERLRFSLPPMGIRSAYLCRYEGEGAAGLASLVAGFRDEEELEAPSFPAADLLPRALFPDRRLSYIVEPLFFRDSPIGYALFETGSATGGVYERLRDSISSALRSVILFERSEEARERAERADGIKTRLLTSVTHELRAPVDMILRGAARLMEVSEGLGPETKAELERITRGAEHERQLVGDLFDFSRSEIDELDIERAPIDPCQALREAFGMFASGEGGRPGWSLELPERAPTILADPLRLKQIVVNLLANAEKHAPGTEVILSAGLEGSDFVVKVADSGPGIEPERLPHLFEPFLSRGKGGVGLGLSIARHLALLHFGSLEAANAPEGGAVFTLSLPLPSAESLERAARPEPPTTERGPCVLLISSKDEVPPEIAAVASRRGLRVHRVRIKDTEDETLDRLEAVAIAWAPEGPSAEEAALFRRLRRRPRLARLPFFLYGSERASSAFVDKGPDSGLSSGPLPGGALPGALEGALSIALPGGGTAERGKPYIILADDDDAARTSLERALAESFPGSEIAAAQDGEAAWALLCARRPAVAILDISMPKATGIEVVKRMRSDEKLRAVPAILLTSKVISMEEVREIEASSRVLIGNKGVLSDQAAAAEASRVASGSGVLPAGTSAIVKRGIAFMNERYASPLTRWQISEAVNASEDYLSRLFSKELGMPPWEYLTRLRIERAKELLASGSESVALVGAKVGFPDQAYFSRVFKKIAGVSPQAYRSSPD